MDKQPTANQVSEKPVSTPPKSSKKGLIIGLAVAGGVVLVALITLLILMLTIWSGPSKQDYRDAATAMRKVRDDYSSASTAFSSYSSSITYSDGSSTSKDQFERSFSDYKNDVAGLKDLKALKDKDVKKSYDEFIAQNDKFVGYVNGISGSFDEMSGAVKNCSSLDTSALANVKSADELVPSYDAAIAPCTSALKKLEATDNPTIADFGTKIENVYNDMRAILVQVVAAAKAGDRAKVLSLQSELYAKANEARTEGNNFSTDFKKKSEQYEVKDQLNALGKLVTDKAQ